MKKEIEGLVFEERTERPPDCPKGITVDQLQCRTLLQQDEEEGEPPKREKRCEKLLTELHWWKDDCSPQKLPVYKWPVYLKECERLETKSFPALAKFLSLFQWVGFHYEVEARLNADKSGKIEWASGFPFAHLDLPELYLEAQLRGGSDSIIRENFEEGQNDPLGVWSGNLQVNLEFPNDDLMVAFRKFLNRQKEGQRVKQRRKGIPWDGLEAFDRRLAQISHMSDNDRMRIKRTFDAYKKIQC